MNLRACYLFAKREFTRFTLLLLCSPSAILTCLTGSRSVDSIAEIYCEVEVGSYEFEVEVDVGAMLATKLRN